MYPQIVELQKDKSQVCEKILRSLPQWFGIEKSIIQYSLDVEKMLTLAAKEHDEIFGFITINIHNEWTAEVHVMAIKEEHHGRGIGTSLLREAETRLRKKNYEYLTVKTLSSSRESKEYSKTRQFYLSKGFRPLEEFKTLWGQDNPCLFMAKRL